MIAARNISVDKLTVSRISTLCSFAMLFYALRDIILAPILGFLLVGAIPGTTLSLPYWAMLLFYASVTTSTFKLVSGEPIILPRISLNIERRMPKRQLPVRRYSKV